MPVAQMASVSDETRKEEERLRLKALSEERASKWPNTLQVKQCQHCCVADNAVDKQPLMLTVNMHNSIHLNAGCQGSQGACTSGQARCRGSRKGGGAQLTAAVDGQLLVYIAKAARYQQPGALMQVLER